VRFAAFTTSYKNFKDYYFKVFVEPDGRDLFYNADGTTKFPFHWTEKPTSIDNRFWKSLSPLDKEILSIVDQLPCRLPTRDLIALYGSSKQWADLNGMSFFAFGRFTVCFWCVLTLPVLVGIILKMDPSLSKLMKNLKKQAEGRKTSPIILIATQPAAIEIVEPEIAVATPVNKKRGRPSKAPRAEIGTSSGKPVSMLGLGMRVAPTMQFDLRAEDEGILAAVPTLDLIEEMVELQCRAAVVSRAIGDELKRPEVVVIPKLKTQLNDSAVTLKNALEAADKCREERWKESQAAVEERESLKTTLAKVMAERDDLLKDKADMTTERESLNAEIEKYQEFMLRINEESFNQGVR